MITKGLGREGLAETWGVVRAWVGELPPETYVVPSVLAGWTVGDLIAHLARGVDTVARAESFEPGGSGPQGPPLSVRAFVGSYPAVAEVIAEGARQTAQETADDPIGALDAAWRRTQDALDRLGPADRVVGTPRGPVLLSDLIITRVLELVVHADDLHRSLPERPAPVLPREGVRVTVRALLDALVEAAPGRSVEVRVPPFAAVQCIGGPRHTRGTPPNVVEADPMTWVRLAAGRRTWAETVADGSVRASGERADLSGHLPLL